MIVLKWVFPVSLAVLAIVHLVSCWRGDDDLRKPTKVALMPVVALAYLAFARMPSLWVVAGLLFGCLGDLFLLRPLHILLSQGQQLSPLSPRYQLPPVLWADHNDTPDRFEKP